jgi:hypothetical protein
MLIALEQPNVLVGVYEGETGEWKHEQLTVEGNGKEVSTS